MRSPFAAKLLHNSPIFSTERLQIRGVGLHETMPPCFVERPGGTGDCFFVLFHDEVLAGIEREPLVPGTMVLWSEGDAHFYGNPERGWSHSWMHCSGQWVRNLLEETNCASGQPVRLFHPVRVERSMEAIYEDLTGHRTIDSDILTNNLSNVVRECAREQSANPEGRVPAAMRRARQWIDARYHEPLCLEDLAREANLSAPYFCQEFRRWFGMPPGAYWLRRRLETAAMLLQNTELDVGEIGRRVGCEDPYHFSRSFKKTFGLAPSHFRAAQRPGQQKPSSG